MPTVPRREPSSTQELKPLPDVRVQGGATAETFGGGASLEKTATALSGLGEMGVKLAIAHQEQMDTALANDIDIAMNRDRNALIADVSTNFKGANAVKIPDYTTEQLGKMREKYQQMAPNPNVLAKVTKKFGVYSGQVDSHGQSVMASEGEQYTKDAYIATAASAKENISQYWDKPDLLAQEQVRLEQSRLGEAKRLGLVTMTKEGKEIQSEQYKQQVVKDTSDIITGTIEKMSAANQYDLAEKYYNENKSRILGKEADSYGDYIQTAKKSHETELIQAQKQIYDDNDRELMGLMFRGKLTMAEVTRRYEAGVLDKSDYNAFATKLSSKDYEFLRLSMGQKNAAGTMESTKSIQTLHTDPDLYASIRQHQLSKDMSQKEIQHLIKDTAGKPVNGLTADDAMSLMEMNNDVPATPSDRAIDSNANAIDSWGKDYIHTNLFFGQEAKTRQIGQLKKEFLDRVAKEGTKDPLRINEIQKEVRAEYIKKRHPEVHNLDDIPQTVVAVNGAVQRLLGPTEPSKLKPQYKIERVKEKPKAETKPKE